MDIEMIQVMSRHQPAVPLLARRWICSWAMLSMTPASAASVASAAAPSGKPAPSGDVASLGKPALFLLRPPLRRLLAGFSNAAPAQFENDA